MLCQSSISLTVSVEVARVLFIAASILEILMNRVSLYFFVYLALSISHEIVDLSRIYVGISYMKSN